MTSKSSDRLLTEVGCQEKHLAKPPNDFSFPLFNAAQALEAQRIPEHCGGSARNRR